MQKRFNWVNKEAPQYDLPDLPRLNGSADTEFNWAGGAGREKVRLALAKENIEARPVWKPMHLQPVFRSADYADYTDYKDKKAHPCRVVWGEVAEDLFNRGLCLPLGTAMTEGDLERVIDTILNCRKK